MKRGLILALLLAGAGAVIAAWFMSGTGEAGDGPANARIWTPLLNGI